MSRRSEKVPSPNPLAIAAAEATDPSPLLTIDEAAAYVRCSTKTLRRWVARGLIAERRVGGGRLLFIKTELVAALLFQGAHTESASVQVADAHAAPRPDLHPTALLSASDPSSDDDWIAGLTGATQPKAR